MHRGTREDPLTGGKEAKPLLERAMSSFRLATSQPAKGRPEAESVAGEAAASDAADAIEAEVVALRGAAWAARELYDHEAARDLIDRAVAIAAEHGLDARRSECLLTRSSVHLEHGRQAEARADLEEAAALAPPEIGAEVAASLGVIEHKAGAYLAALDAYSRALDLASPEQVDVRFKASSNGALCASRLGRHDRAAQMIEGAVDVAKHSSAVYVAHAAHNRAVLAAERGDPTAALAFFDEALDLWRAADLVPAEHHLEKAETFLALRLLPEADAAVTAALRYLDRRPGAALLHAEGLLLAAEIADNRGDHERAIELNQQAASTFADQNRTGWWAIAEHAAISSRFATGTVDVDDRGRLDRVEKELERSGHTTARVAAALTAARVARRSADRTRAVEAYARCAQLGRRGSALLRIQGWVAEAERADLEGDGRRVSSAARAGLRTLDGYRSTFDAVELRARAAAYGEGLAAVGLRWAVSTRRPERIWSWLERTRAAALIESPPVGDDEQTELALGRLRAATAQVAELEPDDAGVIDAQRELARAEHELRAISWTRSRSRHDREGNGSEPTLGRSPTSATLDRIQAALGGKALVQYGIVDGELVAVVVTEERRAFVALGGADDAISANRDLAFALRRLGRSRPGASAEAAVAATDASLRRLDGIVTNRALLRSVASCEELVVVPPGELASAPWAGLPSCRDRPTTVAPSATAWWVTNRRLPPDDSQTVALAGPRLQHAAEEARRVADQYRHGSALVGTAATGAALRDRAERIGTVHVAAHGHLRHDSPTFSSFELADGPFTVHDIGRLPSPVQRWVLASCDLGSAAAAAGPGSDLEGIVAALLSAGAGSVVASPVEVPDESTTALMISLHRGLAQGKRTPVALHDARRRLDESNPSERVVQLAFTCFGAA